MALDCSPTATLARTETICQAVHDALVKGLVVARRVHRELGYDPAADTHLYYHLVRREAMERLKAIGPQLEDHDNLGLPMSGLIIITSTDVIRVWHTQDGQIPVPSTDRARAFVRQQPVWTPGFDIDVETMPGLANGPLKRNHLVLQWTDVGEAMHLFSLNRPTDIARSPARVVVDWSQPLLGRLAPMADLTYTRRTDAASAAEAQTP